MFWNFKSIVLGLYLNTLLYTTNSFVLLTANVDDLKKIARKFISDSLADKIAQFIIAAADNNIEIDNNNFQKNLSEYNDEYDENKDTRQHYTGEFRHKQEDNPKQEHKPNKHIGSAAKTNARIEETYKVNNKKMNKKRKQHSNKIRALKEKKVTTGLSSLEYYKSNKHLNELGPNSIVVIDKILDSDDWPATNRERSRKEFDNNNSDDKTDEVKDQANTNTNNYRSNAKGTKPKKDISENASDGFDHSKRLNAKSEEISTHKTNVTTEIERNEFDQYFNTNYPKAEVVATSGPLELTKSTKKDPTDSDYN